MSPKRLQIAILKLGIVHVRLFGTFLQMSTNNYTIHLPNQTKCVYCQKGWGKCMHHHRHSSAAGIATICRYMTASLLVNFPPYVPYVLLQLFVLLLLGRQGDDDLFFCTSAACYCACAVSCEEQNSRPLCQWNANAVQ